METTYKAFHIQSRDGFSFDKRWKKNCLFNSARVEQISTKAYIKELFEGIEEKREKEKRCCQYSQSLLFSWHFSLSQTHKDTV